MLDPVSLSGKSVLLLCDDMFTGEYVRTCLVDAGAHVTGPIRQVQTASRLLAGAKHPDCALVSQTVGGTDAGQIVTALQEERVPVVLILRHNQVPDDRLAQLPRLTAPFGGFQAVDAVKALTSVGA
jgi:hypothetical protein